MKEIEVKIPNINRRKVQSRLIELGAKKHFDGILDSIFLSPAGKKAAYVRLRKAGKKVFLATKRHVDHSEVKIRDEFEVEVSDFGNTKQIFESLGFKVWLRLRKHRTSYTLGNVHFEIDKYSNEYGFVPEFLEIEAKSIKEIYKYASLLGFKKKDCKPWTFFDLVKHSRH